MKQKQPPEVFCEKVVLKNFAMFIGKHLCQSLFFNIVTVPSSAALLKKRPLHRCFRVNIVKFLRMLILKNTCERLLLMKIDFEKTNKLCPLGNEVAKSFHVKLVILNEKLFNYILRWIVGAIFIMGFCIVQYDLTLCHMKLYCVLCFHIAKHDFILRTLK